MFLFLINREGSQFKVRLSLFVNKEISASDFNEILVVKLTRIINYVHSFHFTVMKLKISLYKKKEILLILRVFFPPNY